MNKKSFLIILLLVIFSIVVISDAVVDNVGDTSSDERNRTKGEISYKEIRTKEIIGFETVYKQEAYFVEKCNYSIDNKTMKNTTLACWNETYYRQVVDEGKKGDPIYSYSPLKTLEYENKKYNFIDKGCSICDTINYEDRTEPRTGKLLLCLSNSDGYSAGLRECWVEDGSSYKIKDLETGKIIESVGEFEVEIEN